MRLTDIRPTSAYVAPALPKLRLERGPGTDWPGGGPDLFDLRHEQTARLYWARNTPSRLFGMDPTVPDPDPYPAIPMGYTTLQLLEKLAIVAGGQLLRLWPHGPRAISASSPYRLILPPVDGKYLDLGAAHPVRFAVADALQLSARTAAPIVLCRVLYDQNWH
ncbi:hypothetical protein [Actinoplanes sp. NPDC051859]|uniref:hypothetical protein n=1 Tax=Actinoplanes sp. NPDC051859 TaxID=3363909 RepID=UPI0037AD8387